MAQGEILIQKVQKTSLRELWEISYGEKADLEWMKFNGPYFQKPVLTWEEFSIDAAEKLIDNPNYAVIMLQSKIVGMLSAYWEDGDLQKWLEFGIVIYDAKLWGGEIGKAVLPIWISSLFALYPEIQRVGFTTWSGNKGMIALGESCGLRLEGCIRKVRFWQNHYFDSVKYGVLREEWEKIEQVR